MNELASTGDTFLGSGHFLTNLSGVGQLASALTNNAIVFAGVVLIFIIIYAGTQMISASGDAQAFARAQTILTSGVIGFVLVLAAYIIIRIIETSTGISILS